MSSLLYASASALVLLAGLAAVAYFRAVAHGYRAYVHVVLASVGLIIILVSAIPDVDGVNAAGVFVGNCVLIGAMAALAVRYRRRPGSEGEGPGQRMIPFRSALVGYLVLLVAALTANIRVETVANQAQEAADQADELGQRVEGDAEANSGFICDLAGLVSKVPATQFEGEPLGEFVDWIGYRHSILQRARQLDCPRRTIDDLVDRVAVDNELVKELDPDEVIKLTPRQRRITGNP